MRHSPSKKGVLNMALRMRQDSDGNPEKEEQTVLPSDEESSELETKQLIFLYCDVHAAKLTIYNIFRKALVPLLKHLLIRMPSLPPF